MKTQKLSNLTLLVLFGVFLLFHLNCFSKTKIIESSSRNTKSWNTLPIKIIEDIDTGGTRIIDLIIDNNSITKESIEKIFSWFDQHIPNDKDLEIAIYTAEESQKKSYETYDGVWASKGVPSARFKKYHNEGMKIYQVNPNNDWANFVKRVDFTSDKSTTIDNQLNYSDMAFHLNIQRTKVMSLEPESEYLIISKVSTKLEHTVIATMLFDKKSSPQFNPTFLKKLDEKVAYFSIGWRYFLTQDSGFTWESWNARDFDTNLVVPQFNPDEFLNLQISQLQFSLNGSGVMVLKNNLAQKEYKLSTKNFGSSWNSY